MVAANVLAGPLEEARSKLEGLDPRYLAAVQRRRELPTKLIQAGQALIQNKVLAGALGSDGPSGPPAVVRLLLRLPVLRALPARIIGFGLWPARLED